MTFHSYFSSPLNLSLIDDQIINQMLKSKISLESTQPNRIFRLIQLRTFISGSYFLFESVQFSNSIKSNHILPRPVKLILNHSHYSPNHMPQLNKLNLVNILLKINLNLMFQNLLIKSQLSMPKRYQKRISVNIKIHRFDLVLSHFVDEFDQQKLHILTHLPLHEFDSQFEE